MTSSLCCRSWVRKAWSGLGSLGLVVRATGSEEMAMSSIVLWARSGAESAEPAGGGVFKQTLGATSAIAFFGVGMDFIEDSRGAMSIKIPDTAFELVVGAAIFLAETIGVEAMLDAVADIALSDLIYCHCASSFAIC